MRAWQKLSTTTAPDGTRVELRRRGDEFLILVGGHDLMSSDDERSSAALAQLGCAHMAAQRDGRVLIGGLGMGFTVRAALETTGSEVSIEVAELVPALVDWHRVHLADLAGRPLEDSRIELRSGDVAEMIFSCSDRYDAILLDVDNGPDSLVHESNDRLYDDTGIVAARRALRSSGVLAVWSFSDDPAYTRRLKAAGFSVSVKRVSASRRGRGRYHYVWVATAGGDRRATRE